MGFLCDTLLSMIMSKLIHLVTYSYCEKINYKYSYHIFKNKRSHLDQTTVFLFEDAPHSTQKSIFSLFFFFFLFFLHILSYFLEKKKITKLIAICTKTSNSQHFIYILVGKSQPYLEIDLLQVHGKL